eukprot:scaffold237477_cov31-Tisochrysis_lutea.AAC.2
MAPIRLQRSPPPQEHADARARPQAAIPLATNTAQPLRPRHCHFLAPRRLSASQARTPVKPEVCNHSNGFGRASLVTA